MDNGIQSFGKLLLLTGVIIAAIGSLLMLSGKLPWLGKLPGDIVIQKKNLTFYFPLATCIILSIIISLLFWLIGRR